MYYITVGENVVAPNSDKLNPPIPRKERPSDQHQKHYMLYPLQVDSLPNLVSAIIEGRNPDVVPINDIYNNSFAIHPPSRCKRPLGILILIKTCFQNKLKRDALRETWANSQYLSRLVVPVEYAFILGHGIYNSTSVKEEFMKEVTIMGDIIVSNFVDTYRNNTFKSLAGLHWGIEHCKDYEFLLMMDDDMYLSLHNLITFLRQPSTYPKRSNPEIKGKYGFEIPGSQIFWGGYVYSEPVHPKRDPSNKWYVTWDQYPFKTFPNVVPGGAIIYSRNVTQQFVLASPFVKHLNLDDVFLCLIAAKLFIKPFRMNKFILNKWVWNPRWPDKVKETNVIAVHDIESTPKMIEFWKKYERGI
ncbi:unnamed protein product [Allacma fusca]|uniref:Hexosyltransferase n=1 Tax=Allacma fusca TaxID=39272 RepID=A0A8J2LMN0_9HEXA|nr:unnamed protein product [Allacma fusca]